jgi:hypothetical protein
MGWQDPYSQFKTMKTAEWDTPVSRQQLAVSVNGEVFAGLNSIGDGPAKKMIRIVDLDGKSGALVREIDFPTPKLDRTAVLLADDGALLVIAGDRVQRVAPDGTKQQSVPLPPQPDINPGLWVTESPSRKTLLLTTDEKTFRFVKTDTLATIAECQPKDEELDELNDSLAISMHEGSQGFEFHEGPFCKGMSLLWPTGSSSVGEMRLLDNQDLLDVSFDRVKLLTINNQTVWEWDPPPSNVPQGLDGIAISQSQTRAAFSLAVYHSLPRPACHDVCPTRNAKEPCEVCPGTPRVATEFTGVVVLDLTTGKQVAMVPLQKADSNKLAVGLSPDGHKLAIMNDSVIELWSL